MLKNSMAFTRRKRLCAVHGEATKPKTCQSVNPEEMHPDTKECYNCGECCHVSVRVNPDSPRGRAMIKKVRENAHILKRVDIDAEEVIKHIKEEGRIPLRQHIGAGDLQWDNFIFGSACSLLVPEQAYDKNWKKTRRMGQD